MIRTDWMDVSLGISNWGGFLRREDTKKAALCRLTFRVIKLFPNAHKKGLCKFA
jgi:hypothetical protein